MPIDTILTLFHAPKEAKNGKQRRRTRKNEEALETMRLSACFQGLPKWHLHRESNPDYQDENLAS